MTLGGVPLRVLAVAKSRSSLDVTAPALRVLIAGGGVAALETILSLRELLKERVELRLLSQASHFIYRPLEVLEPFDTQAFVRLPWPELAAQTRCFRIADDLASVDVYRRSVKTTGGHALRFDALVLALGARPSQAVPGTMTFGAPGSSYALTRLLQRIRSGALRRVIFACPAGISWTIATYELALLSAHSARDAGAHPEITVVTPEDEPLEVLGAETTTTIRELLADSEVELVTGVTPIRFLNRTLITEPETGLGADAVVSLPNLRGPAIPGVPSTEDGFIRVDRHGRVDGCDDVYAAGDATDFPVKQGGLATQQADQVAAEIAARAGLEISLRPEPLVLRALLLAGGTRRFIRHELGNSGAETELTEDPLWWPPAKIVGRRLAPFLATGSSHNYGRTERRD